MFVYKYLEKFKGVTSIKDIDTKDLNEHILSLDSLKEKCVKGDYYNALSALIKKENPSFNELDNIHKIFHYTIDEKINELNNSKYYINSEKLIDLIENYIELNNEDFFSNTIKKVVLLSSLRAWIESKIYSLISNEEVKSEFINCYTFNEKINIIFEKNGNLKVKLSKKLSRKYLMSKKVFLNHSVHYNSTVIPLQYPLSVSIDDINNDIQDLKEYFKNLQSL
ncbi:hypothetical protein [Spiroplasma clarkii]|nr:hypothetical protein [Spiroplasma clarkii]